MTSQWYALRTKPHKEQLVLRQLQSAEIEAYFPCLRVKPVNPRARKIRPYFPGYMFVQLDLDEHGSNALSWLPGSRGLVVFGDQPSVVPDNLITRLRQDVAAATQREWDATHNFRPGDRVRIVDGPFAGYEALFDKKLAGNDRVQLLLAFLSRHAQPIQLPTGHIRRLTEREEKPKHVHPY
ncbi:MAG: hypothetical protein KDE04_14400 [Anaerolineales bacterium]|nr:hypothetical protein [Anaerolineales bacterium]MCB0011947.1 hypothetical protein [Anaerolineales bacterium]MCB0026865.1 hypothetical protein [Anaerolineales bacterium]